MRKCSGNNFEEGGFDAIFDIECPHCGHLVEFFKDEINRRCSQCKNMVCNNRIGEHSFATRDVPIANGRPDSLDLQKAMAFGARVKEKVTSLTSSGSLNDFANPGTFPYEAACARPMAVSPVTNEDTCTVCGTCASVCPTAAISINGSVAKEEIG
jgi:hypothetical protein